MKMLSVDEAKEQLAALVEDAKRGEEIVITRDGQPVARLIPETTRGHDVRAEDGAIRRLRAMMAEGLPFGGIRWSRAEIYDDRMDELVEGRPRHRT